MVEYKKKEANYKGPWENELSCQSPGIPSGKHYWWCHQRRAVMSTAIPNMWLSDSSDHNGPLFAIQFLMQPSQR